MSSEAKILFDRLLPETLEPFLARALGQCIPRAGANGRFQVSSAGRFTGRIAADLLAFSRNRKANAAFLIVEEEVVRVLYLRSGVVIGADSNVLFERLGRILLRGGVVERGDAEALSGTEESRGLAAAVRMLPREAAVWGIEKRTWEIGTALYFMSNAHFLFVDGVPNLGDVPAVAIAPMQIAMEGLRRYDEWRHETAQPAAAPSVEDDEPPVTIEVPNVLLARRNDPAPRAVDEIMRMLED